MIGVTKTQGLNPNPMGAPRLSCLSTTKKRSRPVAPPVLNFSQLALHMDGRGYFLQIWFEHANCHLVYSTTKEYDTITSPNKAGVNEAHANRNNKES